MQFKYFSVYNVSGIITLEKAEEEQKYVRSEISKIVKRSKKKSKQQKNAKKKNKLKHFTNHVKKLLVVVQSRRFFNGCSKLAKKIYHFY